MQPSWAYEGPVSGWKCTCPWSLARRAMGRHHAESKGLTSPNLLATLEAAVGGAGPRTRGVHLLCGPPCTGCVSWPYKVGSPLFGSRRWVQRGWGTCPRGHMGEWQHVNQNPGLSHPEPRERHGDSRSYQGGLPGWGRTWAQHPVPPRLLGLHLACPVPADISPSPSQWTSCRHKEQACDRLGPHCRTLCTRPASLLAMGPWPSKDTGSAFTPIQGGRLGEPRLHQCTQLSGPWSPRL